MFGCLGYSFYVYKDLFRKRQKAKAVSLTILRETAFSVCQKVFVCKCAVKTYLLYLSFVLSKLHILPETCNPSFPFIGHKLANGVFKRHDNLLKRAKINSKEIPIKFLNINLMGIKSNFLYNDWMSSGVKPVASEICFIGIPNPFNLRAVSFLPSKSPSARPLSSPSGAITLASSFPKSHAV